MPVTITISEDQAMAIAAQIGVQISSLLSGQQGGGIGATNQASGVAAVRNEVLSYPVGYVFRNVDLQHKLKLKCETVSKTLTKMRGEGKVKMVQRGTWTITK